MQKDRKKVLTSANFSVSTEPEPFITRTVIATGRINTRMLAVMKALW